MVQLFSFPLAFIVPNYWTNFFHTGSKRREFGTLEILNIFLDEWNNAKIRFLVLRYVKQFQFELINWDLK